MFSVQNMAIKRTLGLVLTAAALAGCGGASTEAGSHADSTSTTTGTPTQQTTNTTAPRPARAVTRVALVRSADAICARLNARLAADKPVNKGLAEIARVSPVHAALELRAERQLARLTSPAPLAREWRTILAYRRTLAEELKSLGSAAAAKDRRTIQSLTASKLRVHRQLAALARRLDFGACAEVG
jgi:hypothetical protein